MFSNFPIVRIKLLNSSLCCYHLNFFATGLPESFIGSRILRGLWRVMADDHRSLSAAIQVPPLSRLNERRPVEWMTPVPAPQHPQLHLPQSFAASLSSPERFVIGDYYIFRQFVRDRPKTNDLALRSGKDQRASQALHSFAILDLSQTRVARG